jgi:hypothetical protein
MKLYRIKTLHAAPKDIHHSIMGYVVAENDKQVMEYIDQEYTNGCWSDRIKDGQTVTEYNDEDPDISSELSYEEWILKHKGDLDDEEWDDAYYGITKFGWEEVKVDMFDSSNAFLGMLIKTGVATTV